MTQTPTIADYPAHAEIESLFFTGHNNGSYIEWYIMAEALNEFNALLEANRSLEEQLKMAIQTIDAREISKTFTKDPI